MSSHEAEHAARDRVDATLSNAPGAEAGFAELSDYLAEACAAQPALGKSSASEPCGALGELLEALARIRLEAAPSAVMELAPRELCGVGLFERVMLSRVRASTWLPRSLYTWGSRERVRRELDSVIEELAIPLASPLIEAEVVRRRLPALVQGAQTEPRAHRPLMERTATTEYVVAPVVAASAVIGLLHADNGPGGRSLSSIDRDLLRMFADAVGLIYERSGLAERAEQQRQKVADACEAVVRSLQDLDTGPLVSVTGPVIRGAMAVSRERTTEPPGSSRLARLTAREREVLALLASGATNAQLADQLTVAESTVKSHVKHILHKLGAGNRAGAIACYMRERRVGERRPR